MERSLLFEEIVIEFVFWFSIGRTLTNTLIASISKCLFPWCAEHFQFRDWKHKNKIQIVNWGERSHVTKLSCIWVVTSSNRRSNFCWSTQGSKLKITPNLWLYFREISKLQCNPIDRDWSATCFQRSVQQNNQNARQTPILTLSCFYDDEKWELEILVSPLSKNPSNSRSTSVSDL